MKKILSLLFVVLMFTATGCDEGVTVTGISINKLETSLEVGSTEKLTATIEPSNATNQNVTWSSNNESVSVENGLITGKCEGTAIITVTKEDGSLEAKCTVEVTKELTNVICEGDYTIGFEYYYE